MAGKSKGKKKGPSKKAASSKAAAAEKQPQGKKPAKKPGGKGKRSEGKSKSRYAIDIFSEAAVENAYYICHNVQDALMCRGFQWPSAQKKKKKGKGK
ncbi:small lysine-rich protein 1 isoform X2 [Ischnura elegans]|uniref:small lysine-rich protein 1 isoform X2 n=1 Tax=Ischnura elegans TaxID=197161 RepID=UPI001ED8B3DC|nr:small lysine-rich protein 1 isoform X2 [Ischnura elegans]